MGPDHIHPKILEECATESANPLTISLENQLSKEKFTIHGDSGTLVLLEKRT